MRFLSLELENFRQYEGKQTVDFSNDSKKNFTIIQGANGCGKTNFMGAIQWCLYGEEQIEASKYEKSMTLEMLNESIIKSLKTGDKETVRVKIILGDDKPSLIIERYRVYVKSKTGVVEIYDESFKILEHQSGGFKEVENKEVTIKRILPKEVKGFFFFDGEKLDSFFRVGSGSNIKKAIFDVSQIELIETTIDHMEKVERDLERKMENVSPAIADKSKDKQDMLTKKLKLEKEKEELEREINKANKDLNDIEDYLRKHHISDVKQTQDDRDRLISEKRGLDDRIVEIDLEIKDLVLKDYSSLHITHEIKSTIGKIDDLDKKKKLPPDIDPFFLRELCESGKCICGTEFSKNSKEHIKIEKMIEKNDYGENADLLLEGRSVLRDILEERKREVKEIEKLNKEKKRGEDRLKIIRERLDDIRIKMEGTDEEEVSRKESERSMIINALGKSQANQSICISKIKDLEETITEHTKDLENLLEKSQENQEVTGQVKLLNDSIDTLKKILFEIVEEVRNTIQTKTEEYFFSMIWNRESFKQVRIDEEYNLSVINNYGHECLFSLSAGQRQVLALSFMAALKEVSGFNAPVIIDTPLGRISGEPRDNIAKNLPDYLKNTQVTLLVTDTEYTPSFKDKINKRTGAEYLIKFNKEKGVSKILKNG